MVVGAEVVLVVELARVAFVAYCAVEQADCRREGVISLCIVSMGARGRVSRMSTYWRHGGVYVWCVPVLKCVDSALNHQL